MSEDVHKRPARAMNREEGPKKRGCPGRLSKAGLVVLVTILLGAGIFNHQLMRLYNVITLFEPDVVVENFRSMERMFDYRVVHRGGTPHVFERAPESLPQLYTYEGRDKPVEELLKATWTTGLIVIHDDKIVYEDYRLGNNEASKCISWSVGRSFVSALMGIALKEGHIRDVGDPVTRYVPFLKGSGYDGVPIKHVLQMSSGIRFDEDHTAFFSDVNRMGRTIALSRPLDGFVASLENECEPGTRHHCVSMDSQVLGMVLREATGQNLSSYLEDRIWKRIGMESDAYWIVDGDGMELAFGGLNVVLRDYARFGLLYLHKGRWNGRQIVPAGWARESVTPDAPHLQPGDNPASTSPLGFGYQWWIPENPEGDFAAIGIYNQFIYVHPGHDVVIAKTSAYAGYDVDGDEKELESIALFRAVARHVDADQEPEPAPLPSDGGRRPPWGLLMTLKR
ncbi:MAG: beta-lactamase family protein [Deltaproteobacteria bacterium]|nr:beta-lactamase family protein [Deltaproteobacteria bacterium]